ITRSLSPRSKEPITTAADLPSAISGGQQESELAQRARVAPPVPAHADREPQEHRDAEERLQLTARVGADALEHGPALADQDPLLRLLLDEDGGADVQPLGSLVLDEILDAHGHRVWHFLVREVEDLLAHDLGDVERLGLVARRVGGEERWMLGQRAHEELEQAVTVGAVGGRDRQQLRKGGGGAPALEEWQQPALGLHAIHLVERAEHGPAEGAQRRQHEIVGALRPGGVYDQADDIDLLGGALGRLLHELVELAVADVQARRVDEDHLRVAAIADAGDTVARGLGPRRDDRELLAHEAVQQRGLAGVGPADEGDEPGAHSPERGFVSHAGDLSTSGQGHRAGSGARGDASDLPPRDRGRPSPRDAAYRASRAGRAPRRAAHRAGAPVARRPRRRSRSDRRAGSARRGPRAGTRARRCAGGRRASPRSPRASARRPPPSPPPPRPAAPPPSARGPRRGPDAGSTRERGADAARSPRASGRLGARSVLA